MTLPHVSRALVDEQLRIRQDLDGLRRRMQDIGHQYGRMSESRSGGIERARVLEELVASIGADGWPVGRLTWHPAHHDD